MGGVLSAGAVAFGGKPANNRPEVVSSMLRGSIVGGMTLFSINLIRSRKTMHTHAGQKLKMRVYNCVDLILMNNHHV